MVLINVWVAGKTVIHVIPEHLKGELHVTKRCTNRHFTIYIYRVSNCFLSVYLNTAGLQKSPGKML